MKIGDKFICKYNLNTTSDGNDFIIGNTYTVIDIEVWDGEKEIIISGEHNNKNTGAIFSIDNNIHWLLYNYFYTNKEIRKLKLNKIGK